MSITKTITNEHEFAEWVKQSDSYSNSFSFEGANALQASLEAISEDTGGNIDWDPIAWCVEFSEYKDFAEFQSDTGYIQDGVKHKGYENIKNLEELQDHTYVIEFDGGIIVQDF